MLGLTLSILGLTLELLLCRRRRLVSSGSPGERPLALANKFKISVNDTTPDNLPLMLAPGIWAAPMLMAGLVLVYGGPGVMLSVPPPALTGVVMGVLCSRPELCIAEDGMTCFIPGEGGTLVDGDGASTTHIRCDRVAHSLATVCARVEKGVMWNTG